MPYLKIYIYFVWCTKNRYPFLNTIESRQLVWNHIKENSKQKGIHVDFVNGYEDHCHCLISLGINQSVEKVMQLIKGESSYWINQNPDLFPNLKGKRFEW
jgi:REP element-mobilizing transposase RayT